MGQLQKQFIKVHAYTFQFQLEHTFMMKHESSQSNAWSDSSVHMACDLLPTSNMQED